MDDLAIELRKRKASLLTRIETRTEQYILSTGKNCIAVVERDSNGEACVRWDFSDDLDEFFKRLYKFIRKKKAPSGRDLDSALTDPVIKIVQEEYQEFYNNETKAISQGMLNALASDEILLKSFVDRIADIALKKISKEAKQKIVELIVDQIKDSVAHGALHNLSDQIGHVAATTAGTQVAVIVAHMLLKLLVANMGAIVAKVMASAALQHALMLVAKKLVLAAVTTTVLHILAAHLGGAIAGASVMWIVIPLMAAYIAYKVATFPEELGEAVSKSVRRELDNNFDSMNRTVLEKIFHAVFGGNELVEAIARDQEFQAAMIDLGEKIDSSAKVGKYGQRRWLSMF